MNSAIPLAFTACLMTQWTQRPAVNTSGGTDGRLVTTGDLWWRLVTCGEHWWSPTATAGRWWCLLSLWRLESFDDWWRLVIIASLTILVISLITGGSWGAVAMVAVMAAGVDGSWWLGTSSEGRRWLRMTIDGWEWVHGNRKKRRNDDTIYKASSRCWKGNQNRY